MTRLNRRGFLAAPAAGAAASLLGAAAAAQDIVDTHVYLSRWPGRRLKGDETPDLVALLRAHGVSQAWAGSFDGLLHKDVAGVNQRLAEECDRHGRGFLVPFGSINPTLPAWEEDLVRCRDQFHMPGIRLHPNYQNYTLRDPEFARVARAASEMGLLIQIAAWMEDERCQHPRMQVPTVDLTPLAGILEKLPRARVLVLNGFTNANRAAQLLPRQADAGRLAFDFAMLDGLMHLRNMAAAVGVERVVFGSYSPMFYFESAVLKVREADMPEPGARAVFRENARRLLAQT